MCLCVAECMARWGWEVRTASGGALHTLLFKAGSLALGIGCATWLVRPRDPPASANSMLGSQVCTTTLSFKTDCLQEEAEDRRMARVF